MPISRQHHLVPLAAWTGAWLVTMALAVFGSELLWDYAAVPTLLTVLLNLGAGIGMIVANVRHVASTDEMMQKIQLEAMAIALGVGIVGGLGYSVLDITNLIPFDAEIGHMVALFAIAYLVALCAGMRRRR